ncbi:hypothetical protein [Streptomyces cucumeris]|nr:hypothetical protein [Streptomyces sp. NEAU-Y11]
MNTDDRTKLVVAAMGAGLLTLIAPLTLGFVGLGALMLILKV